MSKILHFKFYLVWTKVKLKVTTLKKNLIVFPITINSTKTLTIIFSNFILKYAYLPPKAVKKMKAIPTLVQPPTFKRTFCVNYFSVFWTHFKESGYYLKGFFQRFRHYHMKNFDLPISITTAGQLGILLKKSSFSCSGPYLPTWFKNILSLSLSLSRLFAQHSYIISKPCSTENFIAQFGFYTFKVF